VQAAPGRDVSAKRSSGASSTTGSSGRAGHVAPRRRDSCVAPGEPSPRPGRIAGGRGRWAAQRAPGDNSTKTGREREGPGWATPSTTARRAAMARRAAGMRAAMTRRAAGMRAAMTRRCRRAGGGGAQSGGAAQAEARSTWSRDLVPHTGFPVDRLICHSGVHPARRRDVWTCARPTRHSRDAPPGRLDGDGGRVSSGGTSRLLGCERIDHAPWTTRSIARAASAWRRSKVSTTSGLGRRSAAARCRASSVRISYWQPTWPARSRQAGSTGTT
jgi:hypothetical protein